MHGNEQMLLEFIQPLLDAVRDQPYLFIFIGLLFAGELILLPSIYLAVTGRLELEWVFIVAVAAMGLSDLVWYYLGRSVPRARLGRIGAGRVGRAMERMDRLYERRGAQLLVGSKFVYGTRTAAQVLAGANRMSLSTYLTANTIGVALLVAALCGIGWSVRGTIGRLSEFVGQMEIAFLVFVVLAVTTHLVIAKVLRERWSR